MKTENKNPAHPLWVTLLCRVALWAGILKIPYFFFITFMSPMFLRTTFFFLNERMLFFPLHSASSRRIIPFNSKPLVKTPSPSTPSKRPVCGKRHKKRLAVARGRILGGNSALPGTHPWMVAIYVGELDFCAGTLVSSCWIVSAAHCFFRKYDRRICVL